MTIVVTCSHGANFFVVDSLYLALNPKPVALVLTRQRRSSPKVQLAAGLPIKIRPSNFPSDVIINTPPGPVSHKFPFESTTRPSGTPSSPTDKYIEANQLARAKFPGSR